MHASLAVFPQLQPLHMPRRILGYDKIQWSEVSNIGTVRGRGRYETANCCK